MPTATLNFTASNATRISKGLRGNQKLDHDATVPEYEDWLREITKQMVWEQEDKTAKDAVVTIRIDIT